MRPSGSGNEGIFILVSILLLTLAGMAVMGGPQDFFQATNRMLVGGAERLALWVQSHL